MDNIISSGYVDRTYRVQSIGTVVEKYYLLRGYGTGSLYIVFYCPATGRYEILNADKSHGGSISNIYDASIWNILYTSEDFEDLLGYNVIEKL